MLRWLKFRTLRLRRKYKGEKGASRTLLSRMLDSDLVHWNRRSATRGAAVGLFWAFTPIPFQMLPAALFCFLVGGNLPLAIIFVWLTNPLTLPPILYLEYRIGQYVYSLFSAVEQTIAEQSNIYSAFAGGLRYVLMGSLVVSSLMMILGFCLMHLAFELSERQHRTARRKHSRPQAPTEVASDSRKPRS